MNSLIVSFKRYFAFGILIVLLIFLLWLRLVVAPKIPKEELPVSPTPAATPEAVFEEREIPRQSPSLPSDSSFNFNYQGPDFFPPPALPLFQLGEEVQIDFDKALLLAQKFGFLGQPTLIDKDLNNVPFYLWQQENQVLSIGGLPPVVHFNNYQLLEFTSSPSAFSKSLLLNKAVEELDKLELLNIDFESPSFKFFKTVTGYQLNGGVQLEEVQKENEASFVGVGLSYKLEAYSVVTDSPENVPVFLVFNQKGELLELTAYFFMPSATTTSINVTPFRQALNALKKQGVVFYAFSKDDLNQEELPVYNLEKIDLEKVTISYYLPISYTPSVKPYYVFNGKALDTKTGVLVDVVVLLPVNAGS